MSLLKGLRVWMVWGLAVLLGAGVTACSEEEPTATESHHRNEATGDDEVSPENPGNSDPDDSGTSEDPDDNGTSEDPEGELSPIVGKWIEKGKGVEMLAFQADGEYYEAQLSNADAGEWSVTVAGTYQYLEVPRVLKLFPRGANELTSIEYRCNINDDVMTLKNNDVNKEYIKQK